MRITGAKKGIRLKLQSKILNEVTLDMKIAIDLVWVKHNRIGGVESYIRNILDGFCLLENSFKIILLTSLDNYNSFEKYLEDERIEIIKCNSTSESFQYLIWSNLHLDRLITSLNVDLCFIPNARKPLLTSKGNKYICTIHDLQELHYPEYFAKWRYLWLKFNKKRLIKSSFKVIAISNYVKNDIIEQFKPDDKKLKMIYNAISPIKEIADFKRLSQKYSVQKGKYLYTVSSLLRHKNTLTLLKMMNLLVRETSKNDYKLLISGIKGDNYGELSNYIDSHGLASSCLFTGYVTDSERNSLMKNASYFLFPSIFEGFGMPVIEAMRMGTKVITTKCASLEEVSKGKALYVDNPFDECEWLEMIKTHNNEIGCVYSFEEYNIDIIARQYLDFFKSLV